MAPTALPSLVKGLVKKLRSRSHENRHCRSQSEFYPARAQSLSATGGVRRASARKKSQRVRDLVSTVDQGSRSLLGRGCLGAALVSTMDKGFGLESPRRSVVRRRE